MCITIFLFMRHMQTIVRLSCTKRGNVSKFLKPGRYDIGPQKMETSGETPYIYIYIVFLKIKHYIARKT
jgi:hypothetical protein